MRQQHPFVRPDQCQRPQPDYKAAGNQADWIVFKAVVALCSLLCIPVLLLKLTVFPAIPWEVFPLIIVFGPFVIGWMLIVVILFEIG